MLTSSDRLSEDAEEDIWTMDDQEKIRFATYRFSARIYMAMIIGIGIVGNVACLILYRRPSFCRYRSTHYLTALAISDLTSLLCLGLVWFKGVGFRWQEQSELMCSASIYVSNTATFLSAWFVMLLTADMAWALRSPYRVSMLDERKSIAARILTVTFIGLSANTWAWYAARLTYEETDTSQIFLIDHLKFPGDATFRNITAYNLTDHSNLEADSARNATATGSRDQALQSECQLTFNDDDHFARSMIIFDMMISFTIPLVTTLVLNGYIGYKLMHSARMRRSLSEHCRYYQSSIDRNQNIAKRSLLGTTSTPHRPLVHESNFGETGVITVKIVPRSHVTRRKYSLGKEATVSSLLIAKSLAYLVLNLPTHAYRFWTFFRVPVQPPTQEDRESEFIASMVVYMLFYTQFSLNFLLYSGHACRKGSRAGS